MTKRASFVCLFVGFILTATGVHASCPIELSPPGAVVKYGGSVSINCSTSHDLVEGIGWEATEGGVPVQPVKHLTWTVKNVTNWDMSVTCFINPLPNATFKQCSSAPKVVLYASLENISISSSGGSGGVMEEEEEYNVTCQIYHVAPVQSLAVKWYKGDALIQTDTFNDSAKTPVDQLLVHSFKPTGEDDGVTFRCEAHLDLRPEGPQLNVSSHKYNITVHYGPSQIADLKDSEVEVGSAMQLTCSSKSNPKPNYSWEYPQADNVMMKNEDGVTHLFIQDATTNNLGSYTCHAWNEKGRVSKTVKVTLKVLLTLELLSLSNGTESKECPLKITPDRMVIPYQGERQSATCTVTSGSARETYWQDLHGERRMSRSWHVDTSDWDSRPVCTALFSGKEPCNKSLDLILYKTPDSASIRPVRDLSAAVEGDELQLQCDVIGVAPAKDLTVLWYRGNDTLTPLIKGTMQVTGCLPESGTSCDIGTIRSPVNVSSTINITLDREHTGAEYRCEAQMDLGPGGPWLPPNVMSSPLNVTVRYKPVINTTRLPKRIPLFRGYPEELVCEADGYPPPEIQWLSSLDKVPSVSEGTLTVFEAGFYNCTASNAVDSAFHVVEVVLKEDYLPLIAGFVAVTVVAISVIFLFIYSIYYKNTKMRRYSLKNPRLSTHNGNVAHNGWDLQLPMTKLS